MSNAMSIAENNNNFAKLTYFNGKKEKESGKQNKYSFLLFVRSSLSIYRYL